MLSKCATPQAPSVSSPSPAQSAPASDATTSASERQVDLAKRIGGRDAGLVWDDIKWLKTHTDLPVGPLTASEPPLSPL
eukprot:1188143-Prorocentrum_minimum.AAC.5